MDPSQSAIAHCAAMVRRLTTQSVNPMNDHTVGTVVQRKNETPLFISMQIIVEK